MGAFEGAGTLDNTQLVTNSSFETNTAGCVEQSWKATFAMNGTRITSTSNVTLDATGDGIVRLVPNQAIPANTTQQGIFGFCASRTGGNALPSTPVIRTQY
jgi:hypothetical protein